MSRRRLTLNSAMDLMRRPDERMVQTNTRAQAEHWIVPSGVYVDPVLAAAIKAHPQVRAGKDGMWPGHDQTWRVMAPKELRREFAVVANSTRDAATRALLLGGNKE
jgi:hypothetical protein